MINKLEREWKERLNLYAKGDKFENKEMFSKGNDLMLKGENLIIKGKTLYKQGHKICLKGDKVYRKIKWLKGKGNCCFSAEDYELFIEGDRLWAEGWKIIAEAEKYVNEGKKIRNNGIKLQIDYHRDRAKKDIIHAKADKVWADAILKTYGNIKINLYPNECHLLLENDKVEIYK